MEKAGLKNSTADTCLFYRTHEDSFLYIALYVDDGLVIVNKDEEIEVFLGLLQEEFKITIGSLWEHPRNADCQSDGSISVNQEANMNKIPKKFNLSEVIGVSTLASHEPSDSHKAVSILQFKALLIIFRPPL